MFEMMSKRPVGSGPAIARFRAMTYAVVAALAVGWGHLGHSDAEHAVVSMVFTAIVVYVIARLLVSPDFVVTVRHTYADGPPPEQVVRHKIEYPEADEPWQP